jgi:hypothetical protein
MDASSNETESYDQRSLEKDDDAIVQWIDTANSQGRWSRDPGFEKGGLGTWIRPSGVGVDDSIVKSGEYSSLIPDSLYVMLDEVYDPWNAYPSIGFLVSEEGEMLGFMSLSSSGEFVVDIRVSEHRADVSLGVSHSFIDPCGGLPEDLRPVPTVPYEVAFGSDTRAVINLESPSVSSIDAEEFAAWVEGRR